MHACTGILHAGDALVDIAVAEHAGLRMQIRISGHVPLQCMFVALSWRLPRVLCPICFADQAPWKCLLRMHAQQLLVGFLVPTALMFLIEQRMRATFLRSRQQKQSKRA